MATVTNLRLTPRDSGQVFPSITLAADIRNIKVHDGVLRNAKTMGDGTTEKSTKTKKVILPSWQSIKLFDKFKRPLGPDKAVHVSQSQTVTDSCENNIAVKVPNQNENTRGIVKYVVSKSKYLDINVSYISLSKPTIDMLKHIEQTKEAKDAKSFLQTSGSHIILGNKVLGGYFELLVCWQDDSVNSVNDNIAENILNFKECNSLLGSEEGIWYNAACLKGNGGVSIEELEKFQIRVTKIGNSELDEDFNAWDESMKCEPGRKVIQIGDRFEPIPQIILQETKTFKNGEDFSRFLNNVWKEHVQCMDISERDKLIECLGLLQYQDRKITVDEVRSRALTRLDPKDDKCEDVPWIILEKWMRMNNKCRDTSSVKELLETKKGQAAFHPMDIYLVIFGSCDMLLQQMLVEKLALSRLSIPFIMPFEDSLQLSIWPLRSIVSEWMTTDKISKQVSLVKHAFKMVSIVRIGKIPVSKSKLLNDIMAGSAGNQETFFHKDLAGGRNKKRSVSNGLIEMSYFLPINDRACFKEPVIFQNLRGDGLNYDKQCSLLSKISTAVLCVIDLSGNDYENVTNTIEKMKKNCENVRVLLLCDDVDSSKEAKIIQNLQALSVKPLKGYDSEGILSGDDLAQKTAKTIGTMLEDLPSAAPIQDQAKVMSENGVIIDELQSGAYLGATEDAKRVMQELGGNDLADAKKNMLPLQGDILHEWSKLKKQKHRGTKDSNTQKMMNEKDQLAGEMRKLREKQFELSKKQSSIMTTFVQSQLQLKPKLYSLLFYKILKLELDDLCRSILPKLRQDYSDKWQNKDSNKPSLKEAEKRLNESSFGLEHLLRECGQLYECLATFATSLSDDQKAMMENMSQIAARYFLSGHPLEIMDGDSGVVPLDWTKAVFKSLETMIGKSKMFVLSVVGVQSSGKSTLLNTMFGLELAVSAGRCTRGIFAQLLDVRSTALPIEYILVLDSEGLCGIDVDDKRDHDIEISTLVIGLADLTIVNIRGENVQQMKDMFEIAVRAFLRMKAVQKWKKQKCIFLHQSVAAVGAIPNLMRDRHTLQDHLDKITKESAEEENMDAAIHKFAHVIDFNCESNVFYIPDLWTGTVPMAHVSAGYSEEVRKIRNIVWREVELSECSVNVSEMQTRLEDMWNGVLADDFLFSFKNHLAVKAYLSLEKKFYMLVRKFESEMQGYLNNTCRVALLACQSKEGLDACVTKEQQQLADKIAIEKEGCMKEFSDFFKTASQKEYLAEWNHTKLTALSDNIEKVRKRIESDLQMLCNEKSLDLKLYQDIECQKVKLTDEADELAKSMTDENMDDDAIKVKFSQLWDEWERNLNIEHSLEVHGVDQHMESEISKIFTTRGHTKFLKEETEDRLQKGIDTDSNSESPDFLLIEDMKKRHIAMREYPESEPEDGRLWKPTVLQPKKKPRHEYFPDVVEKTNGFIQQVKSRLDVMISKHEMFIPPMANEILEFIIEQLDAHNKDQTNSIMLTPRFEAMISIHIKSMATRKFNELNANYKERQSLKSKLKQFKNEIETFFVNNVQKKKNEATIELLCSIMKSQMEETVQKDQTRRATDSLSEVFQHSKHTILVKTLEDLAQEEIFDNYVRFAKDPIAYTSNWLTQYMNNSMFDSSNGMHGYGKLAKKHVSEIMKTINSNVMSILESSSTEEITMNKFVSSFEEKTRGVIVLTDQQKQLLQKQSIMNKDHFKEYMSSQLKTIERQLVQTFSEVTQSVVWDGVSPDQNIMSSSWGCMETCPRCQAPCIYEDPSHPVDHEAHQHWPGGVRGLRWTGTNELSTEICNFLVASEKTFLCGACKNICKTSGNCAAGVESSHAYKNYRDYFPKWSIGSDESGEASKYWQWVMHTFKDQLGRDHKANPPNIPNNSWGQVSKEEAIQSLQTYSD